MTTATEGSYVAYVHPSLERAIRKLWAWEAGSPIRQHAKAGAQRARKRALLRDWRPAPIPTFRG